MKQRHKEFMDVVKILVKQKLESEPIQAVLLGGSVARGEETEYSDIDIVFYVLNREIPKDSRRFYKFKGKYIEESYFGIETINPETITPEIVVIFDKTNKIKKRKFNKKLAKKTYSDELKKAEKSQKIAKQYFKKKEYLKSFNLLYNTDSPVFILMHSIPPRFNLPFPSFRLLESIKKIDEKERTKTYEKIKKLYEFKNSNKEKILSNFLKAYRTMRKIKKEQTPSSKNLGFFDKTKIKYNHAGLKKTFEDYPFVFAYRFIVGCLTSWAFSEKEHKELLYKRLLNVLGVSKIDQNLVQQKLEFSEELLEEAKKLL